MYPTKKHALSTHSREIGEKNVSERFQSTVIISTGQMETDESSRVSNTSQTTFPTSKKIQPSSSGYSTAYPSTGQLNDLKSIPHQTKEFWKTVMGCPAQNTKTFSSGSKQSPCDKCGALFKRKYDLFQHNSAVHLKERPFSCSGCSSRFAHKGTLSKHIRTVHRKEKPYRCEHCGLKFSERGNVNKHKLRVRSCKENH